MGVKVTQLQPLLPHATSSPQTFLPPSIPSPCSSSSKTRALSYPTIRRADDRRLFLGSASVGLWRIQSLENPTGRGRRRRREQSLRRAISASLESFPGDDDEEFLSRLHELTTNLHQDDQYDIFPETTKQIDSFSPAFSFSPSIRPTISPEPLAEPLRPEPGWQDGIVAASVERKANSVELPLSLRIIKRKKRWEEGFREAGESACCSVKKAFSSMVFIIREVQSYTLHMREALLCQDLEGILARVQQEMHASFVWLFQQIFSCTPTLMLFVMLLLANFTVYSMAYDPALAAASPNPPIQSVVTLAEDHQCEEQQQSRFGPSSMKTFSIGRTASVGGNSGGGGKVRPVAGATDDGWSDGSSRYHSRTILPGGSSTVPATNNEEGLGEASSVVTEEEETVVWDRVVEEASRIQASMRHEALMDPDILRRFVSPVIVEMEPDDHSDYFRMELMYHQAVSQQPDNPLLLSNFAQFLYLVLHDHDRAEYYFKRAMRIQPADAESLSKYANFLWLARKDLSAAEETYLEAIAADPGNSYHAANYAHFLWSTGGEDTCYPLDDPECQE